MLYDLIKSVIDMDEMPVVICDIEHTIVYMNPAAIARYHNRGGSGLIGQSIFDCHNEESCRKIQNVVEWFGKSDKNNKVFTFPGATYDVYMIALRDELGKLIGYYEKHEGRERETMERYKLD